MDNQIIDTERFFALEEDLGSTKQEIFDSIFQSSHQNKIHKINALSIPKKIIELVQNTNHGKALEIKKEYVDQLVRFKINHKVYVKNKDLMLKIFIDYALLENLLKDSPDTTNDREEQIVTFIKNDASTSLMRRMFGLHKNESTTLKKQHGIKSKRGRPWYSDQEQDQVVNVWNNCHELDEVLKFMEVMEQTKLSLKKINCIIEDQNLMQ